MKKYYLYLGLVISLAVVTRFSYFTIHGLWPDEALYAGAAFSLYNLKELSFNYEVWEFHPPLFIFSLAFSYLLLGFSDFAARVVTPVFGVFSVIAVYYLGSWIHSNKVGVISAFFVTVLPLHWFLSERILLDVPFTVFYTLGIAFFYRGYEEKRTGYLTASGIFIGLAGLTKEAGAIIYLVLVIYLIMREGGLSWVKDKSLQILFLVSFLIQVPWYIRNLMVFGKPVPHAEPYIIFGGSTFYYLIQLPYLLTVPLLLALLLGIYFSFKLKKRQDLFLILNILVFLAVITYWPEKVPRYFLPAVPFISVLGAMGINEWSKLIKSEHPGIATSLMMIFIIITGVYGLAEGRDLILSKAQDYQGYDRAGEWLVKNTPEDALIITSAYTTVHYYSHRKSVVYPEDKDGLIKILEQANRSGKRVFLEVDIWSPRPDYFDEILGSENINLVFQVTDGSVTLIRIYEYYG